jgi:hypothetical protein
VILELTDFINKSGVSHSGLLEVVDAMKHYMQKDPVVTLELPSYISSNYFLMQVRGVSDANGFWDCIRKAKDHFQGECLAKKQASVIAERIVGITKTMEVQKHLQEFFPRECAALQLEGGIQKQVFHVSCITWCREAAASELACLNKDLADAICSTADPKNTIPQSLTVFPAGRSLLAEAKSFQLQIDLTLSWNSKFHDMLDNADLHLSMDSIDIVKSEWSFECLVACLLDSERAGILKQHFNELVVPKVDKVVKNFIDAGATAFIDIAMPFFRGECSWQECKGIDTLKSFLDAFVKSECILQSPFCMHMAEAVGATKKLGEILYVVNKVHTVDTWLKPGTWDKESLAVRGLLSKGFHMGPETAQLIGEESLKVLTDFEGGAFKEQADLAASRVAGECRAVLYV